MAVCLTDVVRSYDSTDINGDISGWLEKLGLVVTLQKPTRDPMHKQWMALENGSLWLIGVAGHGSDAELVNELAIVQPELLTPIITHVNKDGRTLLHVTAVRERMEALGVLLKNTLDIDTRNGDGNSPLYTCINHNSMAAAQLLVQFGADVSEIVCRLSGETMLHKMVKAGRIKIVEFLLQSGSAVDAVTRDGDTALHFSARYNKSNMAAILLDAGGDVNAINESGETALHVAINNMNLDLAKLLIKRKANLTIKDNQGRTTLHIAVAAGLTELVRLMLSTNSSHINSKESLLGRTPLLLACSNGTHKMAALLLTHGADANLTTNYRKSVLHVAASSGNAKVLGTVIRFTSNLNALAINNMTALHYAVHGGHTDIVRLLLTSGSSSNMKDIHGMSALHMASSSGYADIVSALLEHDAQIDSTNMEQQTSLHIAMMKGHEAIGQLLISAGSDVNLLDVHDKKAFEYFDDFCDAQAEKSSFKTLDSNDLSQDEYDKLHVHFSAMENENKIYENEEDKNPTILDSSSGMLQLQSSILPKENTEHSNNITNINRKNMNTLNSYAMDEKIEEELASEMDDMAINDSNNKDNLYENNLDFEIEIESVSEPAGSKGTRFKRRNSSHSRVHKSSKSNKPTNTKKHSKSKTKSNRRTSRDEKEHGLENNSAHDCHQKLRGEFEVSTLLSSMD